jgi:signal peptidase I
VNSGAGRVKRPIWRRLLLALVNLVPSGIGLVWLGRYRAGVALVLGGTLLPYSIWLFPPSRGNEVLLGWLLAAVAVIAIAVFFVWSTILLWSRSRYIEQPFPQRWHWPFWLLSLAFLGGNLLVPDRLFRPIRSFYFPSESMTPTLGTSDRAWADMRRPGDIQRGDVVVYRHGGGEYAKRVMAIGGDRIAVKDGIVILNGRAALQQPVGTSQGATRLTEQLLGRPPHLIEDRGQTPQDTFAEQRVPAGTIFVMGDNRDNAMDSRFGPEIDGPGLVPTGNVVGRVFLIYWSKDRQRIGTSVQ